MNDLKAAMDGHKPQIADAYVRIVTNAFCGMVKKLGPNLNNVGNDWDYARLWTNTVRQLVDRHPDGATLNSDRLAIAAAHYADAVVAEWEGKIAAKMGEIEGAEVVQMGGVAFTITGTRAGHRVSIEQQMIVNFSSQGRVFNQFPARIYVDGKIASAAAYAKASA